MELTQEIQMFVLVMDNVFHLITVHVHGWSGLTCSIPSCFGINSTNSQVCSGQGICVYPSMCNCNVGFIGYACQYVQLNTTCFGISSFDSNVCNGASACIQQDKCICDTTKGLENNVNIEIFIGTIKLQMEIFQIVQIG